MSSRWYVVVFVLAVIGLGVAHLEQLIEEPYSYSLIIWAAAASLLWWAQEASGV